VRPITELEDYAVNRRVAPNVEMESAIEGLLTGGLAEGLTDAELNQRVEAAYWTALDEATSPADGEARLRRLVAGLERPYPSADACLADDLAALRVHLA
jgi:hypothetical protein